jgi:uncharacterized protein YecE (DUF72 family)
MPRAGPIRVGTSGWVYREWRGRFYPPDLPTSAWFGFFSKHFTTVEINNTFYRRVPDGVFRAWKAQAPPGFLYAVKASRLLTHRKKLIDAAAILPTVLDPARLLGPHLGPILYQLPPRWRCNPDRLRTFCQVLPAGLRHVVEFRDPSWYTDEVRDILDEHGVGFCVHDLKGEGSPVWATGPLAYVRFHGPAPTAYRGRYGKARLRTWADRIGEFSAGGREVFAYFNNDVGGAAVDDARDLLDLLADGRAAVA